MPGAPTEQHFPGFLGESEVQCAGTDEMVVGHFWCTGSGGSGVPVAAHGEQANDEERRWCLSRAAQEPRHRHSAFRSLVLQTSATAEMPCPTIGQILFRWLFTHPYPTTLPLEPFGTL